jgi:hypothetical protein
MDLNYTSEDEAFRGHVRTWLPNTGQVRLVSIGWPHD